MELIVGKDALLDERLLAAEAVVFDVGNVLLTFEPEKVVLLLPEEYRAALRAVLFGPEHRWYEFDLSRKPNGELAAEIALEAGVPDGGESILYVLEHFPETLTPLPLYHTIPSLKERGKRVFLLSNYAEPSFRLTKEAFPWLKEAEGEVVSSREKVCKPDPEIYRRFLERYPIDPAQTLYIDDAEANVRAGEAAGFRVWHYRG
ncbi:MAG: HAD-IA family hydrolase [Oscillospiraceae bacterium]|nr:HAD-IA family hydrolase [Oscillospiraceae bacterium]